MTETVTEVQTGTDAGTGTERTPVERGTRRPASDPGGRTITVVKSRSAGPELRTPMGTAPIIPVLMIGAGFYLLWFMSKYWRGTGPAVWPSYPIKSVLQGKGLPPAQPAPASSAQVATYEQGIGQQISSGGQGIGPPVGPQPSGSAQNMAKLLLSRYGWGLIEMESLIPLWTRESGWNPKIANPSGAFGIAQALGHGTNCSAASNVTYTVSGGVGVRTGTVNEYGPEYGLTCADAQAANAGSALQQIRWGLGYIKSRYGSPAAAWSHELSLGWY